MRYLVRAVRGGNEVSTLEVEAPDQASLATHADLRGWTVLAITPQQFGLPDLLRLKPGAKFPILLFSRELLALLKAGLSLIEVAWQWNNSGPFGNNVPNENPSGFGSY